MAAVPTGSTPERTGRTSPGSCTSVILGLPLRTVAAPRRATRWLNLPVLGTARVERGELLPIALVRLWGRSKEESVPLIFPKAAPSFREVLCACIYTEHGHRQRSVLSKAGCSSERSVLTETHGSGAYLAEFSPPRAV